MRELKIFVRENSVFTAEDGKEIRIKSFGTEEEAEGFVSETASKLEQHINAYFMGEEFRAKGIGEVKEMLKDEPDSPEKTMLNWALGILDNAQRREKQ